MLPPARAGSTSDQDDPAGLIRAEVVGAGALLVAMLAALAWANLGPAGAYAAFWDRPLAGALGSWTGTAGAASAEVRQWLGLGTARAVVNTALLAVFFLAVGLEVGRERREGSLSDTRQALLPVAAALGGMAGAALTYVVAVTAAGGGSLGRHGWGVPMATDVAFTLAAIALIGRRVPPAVRVFVLALAVADDIASVVVLAVVSANRPRPVPLLVAIAVLVVTGTVLRRRMVDRCWPYVAVLVAVWVLLARAGVEPPLAGAFVGMLVPCGAALPRGAPIRRPSPNARLERVALPLSTWLALPLFALANTGIVLRADLVGQPTARAVAVGIVAARVVGKPVGITVVTALVVRMGLGRLPEGARWTHIVGIGALCGMGFTVPVLFAEAAYRTHMLLADSAELGLLVGTVIAGTLGVVLLARAGRERQGGPGARRRCWRCRPGLGDHKQLPSRAQSLAPRTATADGEGPCALH